MPQQERCPPCVDDFLYICDDAYKREELIAMEISILNTLKFDINIPIAYRFLRRFAKVGAVGGQAGVKVPPGTPCVGSLGWPCASLGPWAPSWHQGGFGQALPTGLRSEDAGLWQAGGVGGLGVGGQNCSKG